ncbi:flocculation protein FLO11-like isoform X3 [Carassius auratus]|uniref:Flocculation protein FLO11-like isoform X3 n=1 Tax=Carassius auratus TaxID=7957 RepID=A0A6P6IZZ4_CARAU|nr:flocculation protein FLO11-like isoform X3 [Carassius auratus]
MRAQSAFIIWTAMILHSTVIKGQTTDSFPEVRSPLNEDTPKDHMTSESDILESRASTAFQSISSPSTNFSTDEVPPTVPSPSQSSRDAVVHDDTSPSSQTTELQDVTTLNTDTASVPDSSASSLSISFLTSTVLYSVASTAPATSISPSEGPQTVSSSASGAIQTTQTAPTFTTTYPQASQIALTSSSKVTGPAPLEDQDESSELDVGDQVLLVPVVEMISFRSIHQSSRVREGSPPPYIAPGPPARSSGHHLHYLHCHGLSRPLPQVPSAK